MLFRSGAQSRILVPRSRYDEIVGKIGEGMASMVVGDPNEDASQIGPMVAKRQQERVNGYIEIGKSEGARVVTGGEPMLFEETVALTQQLRALGMHITIETAGTVVQPVACDLMSISPFRPVGKWSSTKVARMLAESACAGYSTAAARPSQTAAMASGTSCAVPSRPTIADEPVSS